MIVVFAMIGGFVIGYVAACLIRLAIEPDHQPFEDLPVPPFHVKHDLQIQGKESERERDKEEA